MCGKYGRCRGCRRLGWVLERNGGRGCGFRKRFRFWSESRSESKSGWAQRVLFLGRLELTSFALPRLVRTALHGSIPCSVIHRLNDHHSAELQPLISSSSQFYLHDDSVIDRRCTSGSTRHYTRRQLHPHCSFTFVPLDGSQVTGCWLNIGHGGIITFTTMVQ